MTGPSTPASTRTRKHAAPRRSSNRARTTSGGETSAKDRTEATGKASAPQAKRSSAADFKPSDAVKAMIGDGFFDTPKGLGDVRAHLKDVHPRDVPVTTLSPLFTRLLRSGELKRSKNLSGQLRVRRAEDAAMSSVGLRVQELPLSDSTLVLAQLASQRGDDRRFAAQDVDFLYSEIAVPGPAKTSNVFANLERNGYLTRNSGRGRVWAVTPKGLARVQSLVSDMDLTALVAEAQSHGTQLGGQQHTVVPPTLAPPGLIPALARFLEQFPFESNVFGMTRFAADDPALTDPVASAVEAAGRHALRTASRFTLRPTGRSWTTYGATWRHTCGLVITALPFSKTASVEESTTTSRSRSVPC